MTNRGQRRGLQAQLPAQLRAQREAEENERLLRDLHEAEATNQRNICVQYFLTNNISILRIITNYIISSIFIQILTALLLISITVAVGSISFIYL